MEVKKLSKQNNELIARIAWIQWTDKSKDIPFTSMKKHIGEGELKIAYELGALKCNGQNASYDIDATINGVMCKCEVKKLDSSNSFKVGRIGKKAFSPIKKQISLLLDAIQNVSHSIIMTGYEQHMLQSLLNNIDEDHIFDCLELCEKNLNHIYEVLHILHNKREQLMATLPTVKTESYGTIYELNMCEYYAMQSILKNNIPEEYTKFADIVFVLNNTAHYYILQPNKLPDELSQLVNIFVDIKLIIVIDEKTGYYIINDISQIEFVRITQGAPRFRIK